MVLGWVRARGGTGLPRPQPATALPRMRFEMTHGHLLLFPCSEASQLSVYTLCLLPPHQM